jgi:hypothetical protein
MSVDLERIVFRFVVLSDDGRRSCDWRIWTGRRRPSDDVYLAPGKLGGELKVSLHRDGWCQHGLDPSIRSKLRSGDRHALDRWQIADELAPGWRPGYRLRFPESELEAGLPEIEGAVPIPASPTGTCLEINVMIGAPDAVDLDFGSLPGVRELVRLDRMSGGTVAIVSVAKPFDAEEVAAAVEVARGGPSWSLPQGLSEKPSAGKWPCTMTERAAVLNSACRGTSSKEIPDHFLRSLVSPGDGLTSVCREWLGIGRMSADCCGVIAMGRPNCSSTIEPAVITRRLVMTPSDCASASSMAPTTTRGCLWRTVVTQRSS